MNILCFIDSLGSGGAQRQLTTLAVGLKKRGHNVRVLLYHPYDHFQWLLEQASIPCQIIPPCSRWHRVLSVRRILRQGWQEVVLAFLEAPCLYAELARITRQRWGLVVGERSANPRIMNGWGRWLRHFHRCADAVIANSHTTRLLLEHQYPFLTGKVGTVYNCVDLERFRPACARTITGENPHTGVFRVVVAASYQKIKNIAGVAKAMARIKEGSAPRDIVLDWYGDRSIEPTAYQEAARFITEEGLAGCLILHPTTTAIEKEFTSASAIGLFSYYEGLPNAVCEGMACGKPIILSNICDASSLVRDGKNGFLCDPHSVTSIADTIRRMAAMSERERQQMGAESRRMAETLFDESVVIDRYEKILKAAAMGYAIPTDCAWPAEIPDSALTTAKHWVHSRTNRTSDME